MREEKAGEKSSFALFAPRAPLPPQKKGAPRDGAPRIILRGLGNNLTMIKPKSDIDRVKKLIAECFRKQVNVTVDLGRNKILRYRGELSGVYPALFTVRPNDKNFLGKTSYSYAEVLCGSVRVRPADPSGT